MDNWLDFLRPKEYWDSIDQIDFKALKNKGFTGLILDLDETIIPKESLLITPKLYTFMEELKHIGFKLFILSNNSSSYRIEHIANELDIPFAGSPRKPFPNGFLNGAKKIGSLPEKTVVIGDQLFTDILGGNLAHMHTILVKPMNPETSSIRKLMRVVEQKVLEKFELA